MSDFYTGVENVFKIIVEELNGGTPKGEGWHKRLLHAVALEVKGVRPAVISFVKWGMGGFSKQKKLEELEKIFKKTWKSFSREIKKFCKFLEEKLR